jgi:hypothetical protein
MTLHCTTLKFESDVQFMVTNHRARVFWSTINYIHCITMTPFFRELTDDKMWSYVIQDSVTAHTANFSITVHIYVNIPHSLWEKKEYIKKKLLIFEDEFHCHVTTHLQKVWALLRRWRSALKIPLWSMVHWTARNNGLVPMHSSSQDTCHPHTSCTKILTILLSFTAIYCFGCQGL